MTAREPKQAAEIPVENESIAPGVTAVDGNALMQEYEGLLSDCNRTVVMLRLELRKLAAENKALRAELTKKRET